MCGICGIASPDRRVTPGRALVENMRDRLVHRGPDGAGTHLGSRRRTWPSTPEHRGRGSWPPADGQRRRSLRHGLQRRGLQPPAAEAGAPGAGRPLPDPVRYRDHPAPVERHGERAVTACAACSRSPSGTQRASSCSSRGTASASSRSTTATRADGTLLFASEIKALLASGRFRTELNDAALPDYLANHAPSGDETLFRGHQAAAAGPHAQVAGRADRHCASTGTFI